MVLLYEAAVLLITLGDLCLSDLAPYQPKGALPAIQDSKAIGS
jgi:hypothetical protein